MHSHGHSHGTRHSHDHGTGGENYAARRHPEHVVLDIGQDMGALIVHTDAGMVGVEVEISATGRDDERSHKDVLEREINGRPAYTAVFDKIREGTYTLWVDDVARERDVVVTRRRDLRARLVGAAARAASEHRFHAAPLIQRPRPPGGRWARSWRYIPQAPPRPRRRAARAPARSTATPQRILGSGSPRPWRIHGHSHGLIDDEHQALARGASGSSRCHSPCSR